MKSLRDFILEAKSTPLDNKEVEVLQEWFNENVKNYEYIDNKGNFCAYFPSRDELKTLEQRNGLNNIPHLTVSKPPRLKGGYCITLYKGSNWAASEFPDPRRAFKEDGSPKYETIEDVIAVFEKNIINGKWKDSLHIDLK